MIRTLLRTDRPVTLVGAGPVAPGLLPAALALAPVAVAADGGGDVVLPGGRRFRAVIGDMDSLGDREALGAQGVALHHLAEQDSTDLEKCLYSVSAPMFLGVGFLGGRVDHTLAAMNVLMRYRAVPVVLIGAQDLCFLCPRELALDLAAGTRVSLFPMAPVTGRVSEGLRWPVAGLGMAPDARVGTSNMALGGRLRLGFDVRAMLVVLPTGLLAPVVVALRDEAARPA